MSNHAAANATRTVNARPPAAHRMLTPLLPVASAICLAALLLSAPALAQPTNVCTPTGNETLQSDAYRHQPGDTVAVTDDGCEVLTPAPYYWPR